MGRRMSEMKHLKWDVFIAQLGNHIALILQNACGRRGGLVVSASDLRPEVREFKPWPVYSHCVLRQNT